MTENKRFEICGEGSTNVDVTTYIVEYGDGDEDCFELYESKEHSQKVCDKLNNILEENEQLKQNCKNYEWYKQYKAVLNENEELKKENLDLSEELDYYKTKCASLETGYIQEQDENWRLEKSKMEFANELGKTIDENDELKSENKRLTDKLNKTALELVDGYISQGKATEISEMSYREFLDYRAKNGKPMELKK